MQMPKQMIRSRAPGMAQTVRALTGTLGAEVRVWTKVIFRSSPISKKPVKKIAAVVVKEVSSNNLHR